MSGNVFKGQQQHSRAAGRITWEERPAYNLYLEGCEPGKDEPC